LVEFSRDESWVSWSRRGLIPETFEVMFGFDDRRLDMLRRIVVKFRRAVSQAVGVLMLLVLLLTLVVFEVVEALAQSKR
jgi:hypothetical protein